MEEKIEVISEGFFRYKRGILHAEDVPAELVASRYGTPCYLYSRSYLLKRIKRFARAFKSPECLVCYSVKANSNLSILRMMNEQGFGADVVSGGELQRALAAGFVPEKIVFAGVGKSEAEIRFAIEQGIYCFNVENMEETAIMAEYAGKLGKKAVCSIRLNLDIDVDTHHYIKTSRDETKFGLDLVSAEKLIRDAERLKSVDIKGFHLHLGSQLKTVTPYVRALGKLEKFCRKINFSPGIIDIGGGFGIAYSARDSVEDIGVFAREIKSRSRRMGAETLVLEPGRYLVGNAALLLSRVLYVKKRGRGKNFVIVDAGMNDLIRPALYESYHAIVPARVKKGEKIMKADIVGPICETGDYLGRNIEVPASVERGDLLITASAGAYCSSMASNYNSRPRACEIMVDGKEYRVIRKREQLEDLWKNES